MAIEPLFTGVGVALITVFTDDGELDAPATAGLAARLVDCGVRAVLVAGSTGEAAALSRDERRQLVEAVRAAVPGVPLLVGTGAPSSRQAGELTEDARGCGADAILALAPPSSADLASYYRAVAEAAGGLPTLAYHFPQVSAPGVPVDELLDLPVQGIKDSSGDPDRLLDEVSRYAGWLYVGSSALLSLAGPLGATGAILALANAEPELCAAAFTGDAAAQRRLARPHLAARRSFPAGIKELAAARWGLVTAARLGR